MITLSASVGHWLSEDAYRCLQETFASRKATITSTTEHSLKVVLSLMANLLDQPDELEDQPYYLASLDPGLGKTEAVCAFLKSWKKAGFHPSGGVLIALSRLEEITNYISRSGLAEEDFGILVAANAPLNSRGLVERSTAPILFTTHEMIRRRTRGGVRFADVEALHFQGRPRSCRIWDEAMLPATPKSLRVDDLKGLLGPLRPLGGELVSFIEGVIREASQASPGTAIELPECPTLCLRALDVLEPVERALVVSRWEALEALSGQTAFVSSDNYHGLQLTGSIDALPDDFAPAIILDASGRVRHTYRVWESTSDNLVRLPSAANDYSRLTIHHWDRPASRSTFQGPDGGSEVLQAVADLINEEPEETWLVIHHKPRGSKGVCRDLQALIDGDRSRVHFRNWGNHHGTNDFREIRNVIILGLWNFSGAVYAAHYAAASSGQTDAFPSADELVAIAAGEHQHNLLQAICRVSVRNSEEGVCGECRAFVIGRPGSDGSKLLAETFPGATIEAWEPVEKPMRGKALQLTGVIEGLFTGPEVSSVPKKDLRDAMGFKRSQDLAQLLKRTDMKDWLHRQGLVTTTRWVTRQAA